MSNHLELLKDEEFIDEFLCKISDNKFLYDKKHEDYKDAKKKGRTIERIGQELEMDCKFFCVCICI